MEATTASPKAKKIASTNFLTRNVVQFRNGFIYFPSKNKTNNGVFMTVVAELLQFGFILDDSAISELKKASKDDVINFHREVISYLKNITGSNRNYRPFWKGFPEQVMEMSEWELWLHQIVHYLSNGTYEPNEWTKARPTAFEQPKYTKISVGTQKEFLQIFTDLVSVNQSLTPDDLNVVKFFVENEFELRFPEQIPFKENLCTLAALGLDVPVKTVTDVLRIAVGMSGGDVSLPKVPYKMIQTNRWSSAKEENPARENFKFKKFTRAERRTILALLEKTNCDASEAVLRDQRWIRLGEILHPGEFKARFPKAFKMFHAIRNSKGKHKVQSWYGKLNDAFADSFADGLEMLGKKPGEFMRRVDALIRNNSNVRGRTKLILTAMEKISSKVSNKVLFEAYGHFEKRTEPVTNRTIMVKGSRKRTTLPNLLAIDKKIVAEIIESISLSLVDKFAELPKLGKVYLDEELKKIPLPSNLRSASSSLRPIVRGTRVPVFNKDAKVIRAFVHWFDEDGTQDIDLTVTLMGFGKVERLGWNGAHNGQFGCYSGDIRHRQGACAEYVDINLNVAHKLGFKYAIIDARNYNGRSFETVTDCVAGFMEREHPKANEVFVPATLSNTFRLLNESSTTIIGVVDLETCEYIHLDVDQEGLPVASMQADALLEAIKPYCEPPKFSVYHLLEMHVNARKGKLVADKTKADNVFIFDDFANSYVQTLKLMGI